MDKGRIENIRRRDGSLTPFTKGKIRHALYRAFFVNLQNKPESEAIADILTEKIVSLLKERFGDIPSVEEIQDLVEEILIREGFAQVAKSYILYRREHQDIREMKSWLGVRDDYKLPINTIQVLRKRYLRKDEEGKIIESPAQMFRRVAKAVAEAEKEYGPLSDVKRYEEEFFTMMDHLEFLPNSPTLMNAGTGMGQLSACFVLKVDDSMESIFGAVKNMALIHKSGGGTGFSFSHIRPKGDMVNSTKGIASGPVSFMEVFDTATGVIKQGGRRRGANMGILRVDHPDIQEFITAKDKEGRFENFNFSVAVTHDFMQAVKENCEYSLISPRSGKEVKRVYAREVLDLIFYMAWKTGDPGMIFLDTINKYNPTPELGPMEATNPCGELPLLPFESCNLGSLNLSRLVKGKKIDWDRLTQLTHTGVRFLDDVIDVNQYPLPEIEEMTKKNRKIGLGVMGFADLLFQLGVPYNSKTAVDLAEKIMKHITTEAWACSRKLAAERGAFARFPRSIHALRNNPPVRNATVTSIAPTGTTSIIAGCSSGIEPVFALSFVRNVMDRTNLVEVNPVFERLAKERGLYSQLLMGRIARFGSIQKMEEVPEEIRKIFVTAFDISSQCQLEIQAAFQKYTDNSVSKTINLPAEAAVEEVRKIYLEAYRLGCKGITVYRYGSRPDQVLSLPGQRKINLEEGPLYTSADAEYAGGCPTSQCNI